MPKRVVIHVKLRKCKCRKNPEGGKTTTPQATEEEILQITISKDHIKAKTSAELKALSDGKSKIDGETQPFILIENKVSATTSKQRDSSKKESLQYLGAITELHDGLNKTSSKYAATDISGKDFDKYLEELTKKHPEVVSNKEEKEKPPIDIAKAVKVEQAEQYAAKPLEKGEQSGTGKYGKKGLEDEDSNESLNEGLTEYDKYKSIGDKYKTGDAKTKLKDEKEEDKVNEEIEEEGEFVWELDPAEKEKLQSQLDIAFPKHPGEDDPDIFIREIYRNSRLTKQNLLKGKMLTKIRRKEKIKELFERKGKKGKKQKKNTKKKEK